ncbi:MAG: alpha/beta fold hydrolase [Amaricoccus sp.]|uniref:alpha/beta fold hydrolase n=1 Tax=Amaricoccus sp. TaxID=1872485 RepID=UPI0033152CD2
MPMAVPVGSGALMRPALRALGVGLALAGCVSLPGTAVLDPPAGRVETAEIARAEPAVVFESGLAGYKESWGEVFQTVATANTVFAYDRPGIGRSASTTRPRDGGTIVADLRALLRSRDLRPPYVLVGHSAGGLYMQHYARRYPAEVAGLVLVDPTHPTQFEGAGALENRGGLASAAMTAAGLVGPARAEFDALAETGRAVLAAPELPAAMPVVILIAPSKAGTPIAAFDNAKLADFANLYPHAIAREVGSGHNIQVEHPEVVIEAIREVLSAHDKSSN